MRFELAGFGVAAVFALGLIGCGAADQVRGDEAPLPAAKLRVIGDDRVDFGRVRPGIEARATLMIENRDDVEVVVDALDLTPEEAPFGVDGVIAEVAPGGTAALDLTFSPKAPGSFEGALVIASHTERGESAPFTVTLVGVAE